MSVNSSARDQPVTSWDSFATSWDSFATAVPELAAFASERMREAPAYLATMRASGAPRVHPVTPILTTAGLYLFMEPTSPKGTDLRERGWFALHNGVPDSAWIGGEVSIRGTDAPSMTLLFGRASLWPPATTPPTATCCSSCA